MKVLQINSVYPTRSTGKITADIHNRLLRDGHESIVCFGMSDVQVRDSHAYQVSGWTRANCNRRWSRVTGLLYAGCPIATARVIRIMEKEKPDLVHVQCINSHFVNLYRVINWLKEHKIKTVVTLHSEFMHTGTCGHAFDCEKWRTGCGSCPRLAEETGSLFRDATAEAWIRMRDLYAGFENDCAITSVSPWLMERAKQSPILKNFEHSVVLNGINTGVFYPRNTESLRKKLGLGKEKVIFHATASFTDREDDLKGGRYVLALAERLKNDPVKIFVAGRFEDMEHVPENIIFLGNLLDQELLAHYYSLADITLITSKKETFSMVTAESLCCGTPVVGFEAGGPESIALPEYSAFAKQGDLAGLERLVRQALEERPDSHNIAEAAKLRYSAETMVEAYLSVYHHLLGRDTAFSPEVIHNRP